MNRLAADAGAVERAASSASTSLMGFIGGVRTATDHTEAARAPIHQIMLAIQREDVLRQKFEDVEMTFQRMARRTRWQHIWDCSFSFQISQLRSYLTLEMTFAGYSKPWSDNS